MRLILVLLLALALRLALWSQPLHQPANDEEEYITVAYDLLEGRGWSFYEQYHWLRAPLYPLFLAGSLWLTNGDLHQAALPNILLSVATVALIYRLTALLCCGSEGRACTAAPLTAALLTALLLTLNTFASLSMSETLFTFLFTAALVLLVQWQHHQHHTAPRRQAVLILLTGIVFGLATLTRSLTLAFLPVVLVWIVGQHWAVTDWQHWRIRQGRWAEALLFVVAMFGTIAPWTVRNCQAYGRCILVETGFSYNTWAFNEPRESPDTIFETLETIANPAERADEATRRGMERLREDPAILLRKLWPNWVYLWRVKPIQDRFLMESYYGDPPALLFLVALLLDDALSFAILLAALLAFIVIVSRLCARPGELLRLGTSPMGLLLLWLFYVVVATMLTHGEARYRHFLYPVLIPFAALLWSGVFSRGQWAADEQRRVPVARLLLGGLLIPLMLYTVLTTYPWEWAARGAGRSVHRLTGDIAYAVGDLERAAAAYQRALEVDKTPDGFLALGDVRRAQGDMQAADSAYRSARRRKPLYIAATARLGDLWREQGDGAQARRYFKGVHASEQAVLRWTWTHLDPLPTTRVDVGDGLDFGYVAGVYTAEEQQGAQVRWTDGRGVFRLAVPAAPATAVYSQSLMVHMRLAAPHPTTERVVARVCSAGVCQPIVLTPTWRRVALLLPIESSANQVTADDGTAWHEQRIELHSPTFTTPDDGRPLGVLVDWVRVEERRGIIKGAGIKCLCCEWVATSG